MVVGLDSWMVGRNIMSIAGSQLTNWGYVDLHGSTGARCGIYEQTIREQELLVICKLQAKLKLADIL